MKTTIARIIFCVVITNLFLSTQVYAQGDEEGPRNNVFVLNDRRDQNRQATPQQQANQSVAQSNTQGNAQDEEGPRNNVFVPNDRRDQQNRQATVNQPQQQANQPTANQPVVESNTQGNAQNIASAKQTILRQINQYRATLRLDPLTMWQDNGCADRQAKLDMEAEMGMSAANTKGHTNFGMCQEQGQNTLPNWRNLNEVLSSGMQTMWNEGPPPAGESCEYPSACFFKHGHYLTMVRKDFKEVAVGIYETNNAIWVNTNFR